MTNYTTHHAAFNARLIAEIDNAIDERHDRGNEPFTNALASQRDTLIATLTTLHAASHNDFPCDLDDLINLDDLSDCPLASPICDILYASLPADLI